MRPAQTSSGHLHAHHRNGDSGTWGSARERPDRAGLGQFPDNGA